MHNQLFKSCIDACYACVAECEHCATECLKEDDIKLLSQCISVNRECALICDTTARLLSMNGENATALCYLCTRICFLCAEACEQYEQLEHCRRCAVECRKCAEECRLLIEEYA